MSEPLSKQEAKPFIDDLMSMGLTLGEWQAMVAYAALNGGPARRNAYVTSGRAEARGVWRTLEQVELARSKLRA